MATTSAARTNGIDMDSLGDNIARYWWVFLLRGLAAIGFGIIAIAWPGLTLAALVIFFGSYAFVDGIFLIVGTIVGWDRLQNHWLPMLEGFLGILVGVLTFINPAITAMGLLLYIAAWSLATGAIEIASAIKLRKIIKGEIWLLLSGVASIVFAFILMLFPAAGVLGLLWVIASYAIVFGALLMALSAKLFRLQQGGGVHHHHPEDRIELMQSRR